MSQVVTLGDINVDIIASIPRYPAPGGDGLAERVEVHSGGSAANTATVLARFGVDVGIIGRVGRDAFAEQALARLADALVVSGRMTGDTPELEKVRRARELATRPILMGSGTTAENIADFLQYADGAIVGSSLKVNGVAENPVDVERVKRYMEAVRTVR